MSQDYIEAIGKLIEMDEAKHPFIDSDKVQNVHDSYEDINQSVCGEGTNIDLIENQPFKSTSAIKIIGNKITISDPERFVTAVKRASNFEVYSKTDGSIQLNIAFNGLTRKGNE